MCAIITKLSARQWYALLAQLDRASGYGPEGQGFESLRACQKPRNRKVSGFFLYLKMFRERYITLPFLLFNLNRRTQAPFLAF